jgi:hypothetical protein
LIPLGAICTLLDGYRCAWRTRQLFLRANRFGNRHGPGITLPGLAAVARSAQFLADQGAGGGTADGAQAAAVSQRATGNTTNDRTSKGA